MSSESFQPHASAIIAPIQTPGPLAEFAQILLGA